MIDNLYISTNCFQGKHLGNILEQAADLQITNIELSSGLSSDGYDEKILERNSDKFRFIVHNYFPPEDTGLVVNLASLNPDIRQASVAFCEHAIELAARFGIPVYGVHSGFAYDPSPSDLGQIQTHLPRHPLGLVKTAFKESLLTLVDHARKLDVNFCIENNVVPAFNLIDGENLLDLMTSPADFDEFSQIESLSDVGYLLDFGHLNVSANAMNFSADQFLQAVEGRVHQVQVTGNDGITDEHGPVAIDDWYLPYLSRFSHIPLSIESNSLDSDELLNSIKYVTNAMTATTPA
jgi:sugar phosphate isomerase/epimerase